VGQRSTSDAIAFLVVPKDLSLALPHRSPSRHHLLLQPVSSSGMPRTQAVPPSPSCSPYPADGFFTGGRGRQAKSSPLSSSPAHFHNSLHPPTCRSETFRTKVDTSLLHEPFPNTPVQGALQSPPPAEVNNPSTVTPQSIPHQTMPRKAVDDSTEP
jgi:hypothetical protein